MGSSRYASIHSMPATHSSQVNLKFQCHWALFFFCWIHLRPLLGMASPHGGAHVTGALVAGNEPGKWSWAGWSQEGGGTCEQQRQACRGSAGQGGQGSPPGAPPQWWGSSYLPSICLARHHWHGWCPWIREHIILIIRNPQTQICASPSCTLHIWCHHPGRERLPKQRKEQRLRTSSLALGGWPGEDEFLYATHSRSQRPSVPISWWWSTQTDREQETQCSISIFVTRDITKYFKKHSFRSLANAIG